MFENVADARCFSATEVFQIQQGTVADMTNLALQYGHFMLLLGFLIGILTPRIAAYVKVKYGWLNK